MASDFDFSRVFAVRETDTCHTEVTNYYVHIGNTWATCIAATDEYGNTYVKDCYAFPFEIPNKFWDADTVISTLTPQEIDNLRTCEFTPQQRIWLSY